MLIVGQSTEVTFNVNVMGTSADPKVRVVLQTSPVLNFEAYKLGDSWVAKIDVPEFVNAGSYDLKVEVILNNRLFTPLTKKIEIAAAKIQTAKSEELPITQNEAPVQQETIKSSLLKSIEEEPKEHKNIKKKTELNNLNQLASKKHFESIKTPLPKPELLVNKPIKIKISEIDSVTTEAISKVVEVIKKKKEHQKPIASRSPVKLIKEQIFYE